MEGELDCDRSLLFPGMCTLVAVLLVARHSPGELVGVAVSFDQSQLTADIHPQERHPDVGPSRGRGCLPASI